ncbi:YdeI/OmpD-associated family protein [Actinomycetes bacterium M1A6_2h]
MAVMDDAPRVHVETRAQWRQWLTANHEASEAVWLVSWRKVTGKPAVSYDDAVSEALAVGWVDSRPRKLDDERTMLYFSVRKPNSAWSRPNKVRIDALRRDGLMLPAGERAVEVAMANGKWSLLDDVEDLVVPDDLATAFAEHDGARDNWDQFPPSARRGILEWIITAKRAETRAARVHETARLAAIGERAAQWKPRGV